MQAQPGLLWEKWTPSPPLSEPPGLAGWLAMKTPLPVSAQNLCPRIPCGCPLAGPGPSGLGICHPLVTKPLCWPDRPSGISFGKILSKEALQQDLLKIRFCRRSYHFPGEFSLSLGCVPSRHQSSVLELIRTSSPAQTGKGPDALPPLGLHGPK